MHLTILPSVMGKLMGRLGSFTLVWQPIEEKKNSEFKLVKVHLKTDLVSHPDPSEEFSKYTLFT